jgi:benzoate/toluate 1,2-dioxygenase alpha subunit
MSGVEDIRNLLKIEADGRSRLDRRAYTDPHIFDLEMEMLWEKSWIFLAHESELPSPNDFLRRQIGRRPIILMRNASGKLGAFINSCAHRGAMLCQMFKGNAKSLTCPYHGWTYDSDGQLRNVVGEAGGAYPESFDKKTLGLKRVPKIDSYRGLVFASLSQEIQPLREYLGDTAVVIDLLLDQSVTGWEVLEGRTSYTYNGNWKLQAENGVDGYHAPIVHGNFTSTILERQRSSSPGEKVKAMTIGTLGRKGDEASPIHSGYFDFGRGHLMIWRDWENVQDRFNYEDLPDISRRMGEIKAKWAVGRLRNLLLFPSLMIMDQMSSQLRVIEPISVDRTKVTSYAIAPIGEAPQNRRRRLRAYEDFFNASGMATPDDLAIFNFCQNGFRGATSDWSDLSRGAAHQVIGANRFAAELGVSPRTSGTRIQDEGLYVGMYQFLIESLSSGLQRNG